MLVVGAGPAGCSAAIRGAARGLTVGIIERSRFPRDLPGEALHPDIDRVFDELGVREAVASAGFLKYPGWILEHDGEPIYVPLSESMLLRFGYQVWRADFDTLLLEHARRCGATVLQETNAREVLAAGRVVGLESAEGRLLARHVIDASGSRRWLARQLSLPARPLSPRLVARYGYSDRDFGLGILPQFREHADGWTWLAKVRESTFQCVRLALVPDVELPPLPAHFGFPQRLRGADVTWRLVDACAGPGYFLCGDAAATLDPAASGGVARAMESGCRAADLVADVCAGAKTEREATHGYREWLAARIWSEARTLASRHSVLENSPSWVHRFGNDCADAPIA
jgi:flavin-dependent dehydrogenase